MRTKAKQYEAAATFLRLVLTETDDCVLWPFSTVRGYPQVRVDRGRPRRANRLALELRVGPPPAPGLDAAHSCGVPRCINYRHLRWATRAENNWDRWKHGTHNMGERNAMAKLTELDVRAIRASTEPNASLAVSYGVSDGLISMIRNGKRWGSVA